ncbi:MAG: hypothetical protein GKR89_34415 [Candidatus Latescibacteria bacterium]|nr:hypothetical protein [Candidatus Latescibacterota bacterium]
MQHVLEVVKDEFKLLPKWPKTGINRVRPIWRLAGRCAFLITFGTFLALGLPALSSASEITTQPRQIIGQGILRAYAISPSRRLVASVGSGGTFLWSLTTGELLQSFPEDKGLLYDVSFSKDSAFIISVGTPRTQIWSIDSSSPPRTLPGGNGHAVAFSEDRSILLLRDNHQAVAWSTDDTAQLATFEHPEIRALDIAPSGDRVITAGADNQAVLWDLRTQERIHTLPHPEPLFSARFSPDASRMIFGAQAQIWIWDTSTGRLIDHLTETRSGDLASDNIRLATKGADRNAHVWLSDPPSELFELAGNPNALEKVQFSPDETWIVGEGRESTWLWDPINGDLAEQVDAFQPRFSPDGSLIAFASYRDGNSDIFILDLAGGLRQLTFDPAEDSYPAWSPDGSHIAFVSDRDGNQEVYLINADGSGLVNFSQNPGFDASPVWLPMSQQTATAIKQASWGQVKNNPTAK